MGRARRIAGAGAALVVLGAGVPALASPGDIITIQDATLTASGALATDEDRGLYWTANPQGNGGGSVHALNPDGSLAGEVRYDAAPSQVEGLAYFNGQLYVGDVGDPQLSRGAVTVYRLESLEFGSSAPYSQWTLSYPDGAHDSATMMVSPRGNIWIVTKGDPGGLYYVPAPAESGEYALEYVADAPAWVTDGTFIGPTTVVLRTYTSVLTYDMTLYSVLSQAAAPEQPQGESLTSTLDGAAVLLGSKGTDQWVEVAVPTVMEALPAVPSVPPASLQPASPEPPETPTATVEPAPQSGPFASKTLTALAIAALVSVGAGVLVYWRTRPGVR